MDRSVGIAEMCSPPRKQPRQGGTLTGFEAQPALLLAPELELSDAFL